MTCMGTASVLSLDSPFFAAFRVVKLCEIYDIQVKQFLLKPCWASCVGVERFFCSVTIFHLSVASLWRCALRLLKVEKTFPPY